MRVVKDAAEAPKRRRGDRAAAEGADAVANAAAEAAAEARSSGLPIVPALLFLLACVGGGVAVALFGVA
ncbi:MAG: hypothetical protein J7500_13710 [Sphingomonas sp.]|nr:hypothetical protein [Sphingomonas sp.]